ncbi:OPT oligopeptide transporter protein-domain-containing protein [Gorgonomyces haynaldii]|nr:OPT oligopeptide transporter protein-domain-containing protein [Gorgonomyces haynaldii]
MSKTEKFVEDTEEYDAMVADEYTKALTPQTDDPNTPAFTFRAVFLGCLWAVFLATANVLFSFRTNSFVIPTGLAQLLSYPMGVFLAWILPKGFLNPGPFSIKEHVLIFIIAGSAGGLPYGVDNVVMQHGKNFINDPAVNMGNSLAFVTASQLIGYGLAGICRRFLVKPAAMLWPGVLPNVALFTALNKVETAGDKTEKYSQTRYSYFFMVFFMIFVFQFFPSLLATSLSTVSLLCLFTTNRTARFLGSGSSFGGIGILAWSFDWTQISVYAPIAVPFYATANLVGGAIIWNWIVTPIFYYTNSFGNPFLVSANRMYSDNTTAPILNSNHIYSKDGERVFVKRPDPENPSKADKYYLLANDFSMDQEKYEAFKPFYLTEAFAGAYLLSFVTIAASISHVILWYGADIKVQFRQALRQTSTAEGLKDTHNVLMEAYPDLPEWIYAAWLAVFTVLSVVVCEITPFHMPWWATLLATFMAIVFTIPIGIIQAVTGSQIGLNVITEFVIGLISPGQTIYMATFKSFGYNVMIQALNLVSDLKLGHYMHISPYAMVTAQLIGTVIGILFNTVGALYIMDSLQSPKIFVDDLWLAQGYNTFLNAAGIWGSIGPARFFGSGTPYFSLNLGFLAGFILPVIPWLLNKYYPNNFWHLINVPLLAFNNTVPGELGALLPALLIGLYTQFFLKRYRTEWFNKYNYVLAIALDSGAAIAVLVITILQAFITEEVTPPPSLLSPGSLDFYCWEQPYTYSG